MHVGEEKLTLKGYGRVSNSGDGSGTRDLLTSAV